MDNQVWYITGASKGLGLVLAKRLLKEGHRVAATSRKLDDLMKAIGNKSGSFLPLQVDLINEPSVQASIDAALEHFGQIDVVVNNAGYGLIGALEELSDAESRINFDVNVFGTLNVLRAVLPSLRKQRAGRIFNIASIGGFAGGYPGFGIYCATKFAVHGFTEALAVEAKEFNIQATVVSPGYFRTNFLEAGSLAVPSREIADYTKVREVQQLHQQDINNNQPGDPEKAAAVLISVAAAENQPVHLFLGADAYTTAEQKISAVQADLETNRAIATATGF
ncbi:MAG: SDR family oxidoreductase [Chitinophagaceae bacterium]|nr:MAG: SDR family oxidoreductase [Chitinophagaceae bacterium]